jgi:hypothetical protein
MTREGNAAFLGTVAFTVRTPEGRVVRDWSTPVAVYYDVNRRFALPLEGIPSGRYDVEFRISTDREDIDRRFVLPAEPIERTVTVEVG